MIRRRLVPAAVVTAAAVVVPLAAAHVSSAADPPGTAPFGPRSSAIPLASSSASASAPTPPASVTADVMVLHASNTGGGIDPRIGNLPQLKKPPFSAYDTYKLLSETKQPLAVDKPMETQLPNGRTLQITLKGSPEPNRYKLTASVAQPGGTKFLPLLEVTAPLDEWFFVAGQSYKEGVLFVGIKLVK